VGLGCGRFSSVGRLMGVNRLGRVWGGSVTGGGSS